jgi:hypothetical protein
MIDVYRDTLEHDTHRSQLADRLQEFFSTRLLPGLRQIQVSVDDEQRTVILEGVVRSLYERRLADDLSRRRACGYRVVNLVDVSELCSAR